MRAEPRSLLGRAAPFALAVVGIAAIATARPAAVATHEAVHETSESFALPPPDQLAILSFGYRDTLADYLWAHVLVTGGLRLKDRRRFETVTRYLDAITSLAPDFREPYLLVDTLTTVQAKAATIEDIREVRRLLERGVERFPNDAEMWLSLGQFVTFIAPTSYLQDEHPEEAERWRREGAAYLARAAELGSEDATIAWRAIGGARHLHKAGERQATIRFIQRAMAVTEDAELRAHLSKQLAALVGQEAARRQQARRQRFEEVWRTSYPTLTITAVLSAGPPFDAARCAGGTLSPHATEIACATSWPEWNARVDAELLELEVLAPPPEGPIAPPGAPPSSGSAPPPSPPVP